MYDYISLNIKCPKCGERLEKSRYASRGNCTTWWRIKCIRKTCEIDTGMQSTMADAYEAFMVMYYGAKSSRQYDRKIPEKDISYVNED